MPCISLVQTVPETVRVVRASTGMRVTRLESDQVRKLGPRHAALQLLLSKLF